MPEDPNDDFDPDSEIDEGTKTYCGRRWNAKWVGCRGRAKWTPKAIFCEANQLLEFCACLEFNDYDLFSYSERTMLLGFDLAFVWVTVVLGHMSELQGLDDAASLSDFTDDPLEPANCDFSDASMFFTQFIDKKGPEHSLSAVGGIFGLLGDGFDVRGGFLAMEVLACLILSLGFGKVAMEHIMINAIPELPKWEPFYWKDSLDIFGLVVGAPAQSVSTTCCQGCCVPEHSSTCGNGQITIRNACFVYCSCMVGWAFIMLSWVIQTAPKCVLPYMFEMAVLMMVTWTLIYPFEASFLACLGFGVDTQATESEDGGAGAASRFVNPMAEDDDDGESSPTGRQRWGAPEPEDMDIVE